MRATSYIIKDAYRACLVFLLIAGCKSVQDKDNVPFSVEGVRTYSVESFQILEQFEIGKRGIVSYWSADEVIVADRVLPSQQSLFNLRTGETRHFLNLGRGPGECLDISNQTVQDGKLYIYSPSSRKVIVLQPSSEPDQDFSLVEEIEINVPCVRVIPTKNGAYLGTPLVDGRFYLFDKAGQPIDTLGSFPVLDGDAVAINNNAFQSQVAFSPDGKYLCSAYHAMDFVEIYSDNFKKIKRLWGPDQFLPRAVREIRDGYILDYRDPQKQVYYMISTSNKGFLVGYVGHLYKDRNDPSRGTKELHYFDWNGNFLARYILPQEVAFFDVDWENGRMCGVTFEAEPKLVLAELEGL
ncbi:MAG: TolB-like 6-bladed beta-propeller domain-containing protein [Bacteroidales bacterium]|nr:TolB-like 6-bladed beta-propeller domain-containing protein [Bacteroidales bacterium]